MMIAEAELDSGRVDEDYFEREDVSESEITDAAEAYTNVFLGDVNELSRQYIERFFADREMHCGGGIPDYLLFSKYNISLILNTNIENGVKRAYHAIAQAERFPPCVDSGIVPDDVKLVMAILKQCAKVGIPKEFAAGVMLLHLEYCEGISI